MAKKPKPIDLLRQQFAEFKRSGAAPKATYRAEKCYVCGRKSPQEKMRYIGKGKDGTDVYRHWQCEAGSSSWLKNIATTSKWRKYFTNHDPVDQ